VIAAPLIPIVVHGMTRLLVTPQKPLPIPDEGNHPSFSEKIMTNTSPSQNAGADAPIKAKTIATLSKIENCFFADNIPTGIPINTVRIQAVVANSTVTGSFCAI
jgi:hypothetical protein